VNTNNIATVSSTDALDAWVKGLYPSSVKEMKLDTHTIEQLPKGTMMSGRSVNQKMESKLTRVMLEPLRTYVVTMLQVT
jgi:hypothetical protein